MRQQHHRRPARPASRNQANRGAVQPRDLILPAIEPDPVPDPHHLTPAHPDHLTMRFTGEGPVAGPDALTIVAIDNGTRSRPSASSSPRHSQ